MDSKQGKRLWVALVEHKAVPGTIPALFYQTKEPSDRTVKARLSGIKPSEMEVVCVLDLSHVLQVDVESLKAVETFGDDQIAKAVGGRP